MVDREGRVDPPDGGAPGDDRRLHTEALPDEILRERLLAAFDMFELGVEMKAANLRRQFPEASPEEIERLINAWLLERPGAELGDGPGVPVPLERFR